MRAWYEASLLLLAAWILDRNVERSMVISRSDNNYIFDVEHNLRSIAKRIFCGYEDQQ